MLFGSDGGIQGGDYVETRGICGGNIGLLCFSVSNLALALAHEKHVCPGAELRKGVVIGSVATRETPFAL